MERKKETTPPPLLLMPAGGGLTLTPPDQPNVLMPVIQSEPSLFGPEDEGLGEADSFVGQSPPTSTLSGTSTKPSTSGLFQSPALSTPSDPFAQISQGGTPQGPPPQHQTPVRPPSMPGNTQPNNFPNSGAPPGPPNSSSPFGGPQVSGMPPPPNAGGLSNLYRKHGSGRYAQMPAGTYATPSAASLMTQPPAPTPFSKPFSEAATLEPTPTQDFSQKEPFTGSQPPAQSLGPMSGMGYQMGGAGVYVPVGHHWCFCKEVEGREIWYPFSMADNLSLEEGLKAVNIHGEENVIVSTDGGRYDVNVNQRLRNAIYWEEEPVMVRRCSWFFKREGDNRYVPYSEEFSERLENEYRTAVTSGIWHKRLEFSSGETIVLHNPNVMVHFQPSSKPDEWGMLQVGTPHLTTQGDQMRPRVVKRGVGDFDTIDEGESSQVDHLVFVVHGIGSVCDLRFRNIVECVDDFRNISHSLMKSHFQQYVEMNRVGRVEFLPIHWHSALHGDATGVDSRLKAITLPSTSKLRHFVNDTLMDILFYTSPTYCQTIADTVGSEINRLYNLFLSRNPTFKGGISVAGHSLGSCILFDLLQHQSDPDRNMTRKSPEGDFVSNGQTEPDIGPVSIEPVDDDETTAEDQDEGELTLEDLLGKVGLQDKKTLFEQEQMDMESLVMCSEADLKDLGLPMGPRKKLQGLLREQLNKKDKKKMEAERRAARKSRQEAERQMREQLAAEMASKTTPSSSGESMVSCSSSLTVEYLLGSAGTGQPQVNYPKLIFNPVCCFALGSPIGLFLSARGKENIGEEFRLPTCRKFFNIFHPFDPVAYRLEPLVSPNASGYKPVQMPHHKGRKRLHLELKDSLTRVGADIKQKIIDSLKNTWNSLHDFAKAHTALENTSLEQQVDSEMSSVVQQLAQEDDTASVASSHDEEIYIGQLNEGRRIDYVLQERPIESFNDYVFSLTSHGCYWNSEDTVLLVLKEIYSLLGVHPTMPGPDGAHKPPSATPSWSANMPPQTGAPPLGSPPSSQMGISQSFSVGPTQNFNPGPPVRGFSQGPPPTMRPQMRPPLTGNIGPPQGMNMGPPQAQAGAPIGAPPMSGFIKSPKTHES